jgi:hypothetical protein
MSIRSSVILGFALFALGGCESEEDPPAESACGATTCPFDYSRFDGTTPEVSLRRDLLADLPGTGGSTKLGLIRRACNFGDCHGLEQGEAGLYLGPPQRRQSDNTPIAIEEADFVKILTGGAPRTLPDGGLGDPVPRGIIRVRSKTNPDMDLVVPGDPANSFLMHKIDGCFEGMESVCEVQSTDTDCNNPCGDRMPASSDAMRAEERDMIRRWIAQGALDDGP